MSRVLITGCSTGIGRATAVALTERGYDVVATARRPETLSDLDVAQTLQLDVSDDASVRAAVEVAGAVDVLINNAAWGAIGPIETIPLGEVRAMYETNVFGVIRMLQAVVPGMRERGRGTVVNVSSLAGVMASMPMNGLYASTKHALEALTETLHYELRRFGVRVVAVQPGYTATSWSRNERWLGVDQPPWDSCTGWSKLWTRMARRAPPRRRRSSPRSWRRSRATTHRCASRSVRRPGRWWRCGASSTTVSGSGWPTSAAPSPGDRAVDPLAASRDQRSVPEAGRTVSRIEMRDVSHAGHELGRAQVDGVPAVVSLGELLRMRIRSEVARYNAEPGPVFAGLVQPADSVRHSDGHHMRVPRPLDADQLIVAAEEAVAGGILWFVVGEEDVTDLARRIDVEQQEEITAVLRRPIVARVA